MGLEKSEFKKFEITIYKTWQGEPRPSLFTIKQHIMPITIKKPQSMIQNMPNQNQKNQLQTAAQPKEDECQTTSVHKEIDGRPVTQYSVGIRQSGDMTTVNYREILLDR